MNDEADAWAVLREHYHDDKGIITMNVNSRLANHQETQEEGEAIDYLCSEWDYEFKEPYDAS